MTGEFEHPVIQAIVNGAWFRDTNAHGVKYAQYFGSHLPLPTLALVLTSVTYLLLDLVISSLISFQIEAVLDEWRTGDEKRVVFSEAEYKTKFEGHLRTVKKWGEEIPEGIAEICQDLLDNARFESSALRVLQCSDCSAGSTQKLLIFHWCILKSTSTTTELRHRKEHGIFAGLPRRLVGRNRILA
jgi:hypothetical protein